MMRALKMLVMLLICAPAWAQWAQYAESDRVTFYYDPATVEVNGELRRVWELQDLKQRDPGGEMSFRFLWEYGCKENRYRNLYGASHSERMARGDTLVSGSPEGPDAEWDDIPPGTVIAAKFKAVCKGY